MNKIRFWIPGTCRPFQWYPLIEWNHCNTQMLRVIWLHWVFLWRWDDREKAAW